MKPNKFFSTIFIVYGLLLLDSLSAQRAALPYSNNFSDLDQCINNTYTEWETNCRKKDYTVYCVGYSGYSSMLNFAVELSTSSVKEASATYEDDLFGDLKLDLSSIVAEKININFDWAIISGEDSYSLDGVYVSDDNGSNFTKILSFEFQDNNWLQANLTIQNKTIALIINSL